MTDFKDILLKLNKNLHTLRQRKAKYGLDVPVALLNEIADHQQAITFTEQALTGDLTEAEWREALQPLNIDHTLIEGGFFQKVLKALSLPTEQQRELRNREIMLQRVHDFWVKGVLENSLHNEVLIELGMETKPEAVDYPWEMIIQRPDQPNHILPPGTKIIDVFDESGGSLLILGEPGSGKTTMLLELARQTIARAQVDPSQPMPVVFNLSSWAEKRQSLAEWLAEELNTKYNIPKKIAQPWVEKDELLLLLDGLDEMPKQYHVACVEAVNTFQKDSLMLLVICSRMADYADLSVKLSRQQAILLQALESQQIEAYLTKFGAELAALKTSLTHDIYLQELAQSPLVLSVMTLAYRDITSEKLPHLLDTEGSHQFLFEVYVRQIFQRRGDKLYPVNKSRYWLTWLARRMIEHSQTLFLIERIQPSWLPSKTQKRVYAVANRLIYGLMIGMLISGLVFGSGGLLDSALLVWLFIGLGIGLTVGRRNAIRPVETPMLSWSRLKAGLILGLKFGLTLGLVSMLIVLIIWPFIGRGDTSDVFQAFAFFGLTGGLSGFVAGISIALLLPLSLDRQVKRDETSLAPNQGIWASSKNGLIYGLIFGLFGGPFCGLAFGLFGVLSAILIGGLIGGGGAFVSHFLLRFILYRNGYMPWNLTRFLDYCVDRIFLRRVGGGYIFIHRYLMEYFASLAEEDIERLASD